jgi:hypothetical protein
MPTNRRFPPPWSVEDNGACFVVRNKLAYVEARAGRSNNLLIWATPASKLKCPQCLFSTSGGIISSVIKFCLS